MTVICMVVSATHLGSVSWAAIRYEPGISEPIVPACRRLSEERMCMPALRSLPPSVLDSRPGTRTALLGILRALPEHLITDVLPSSAALGIEHHGIMIRWMRRRAVCIVRREEVVVYVLWFRRRRARRAREDARDPAHAAADGRFGRAETPTDTVWEVETAHPCLRRLIERDCQRTRLDHVFVIKGASEESLGICTINLSSELMGVPGKINIQCRHKIERLVLLVAGEVKECVVPYDTAHKRRKHLRIGAGEPPVRRPPNLSHLLNKGHLALYGADELY